MVSFDGYFFLADAHCWWFSLTNKIWGSEWSPIGYIQIFCVQVLQPGKHVFQKVQTCLIIILRDPRQQMPQIFVDLQVVRLGGFY